jgi:hypothetical protein
MIDVVLAIIQEKVNNPTPDDPFEPEIAAVKNHRRCLLSIDGLLMLRSF